jgi:hypothetical protein
MSYICLAWELAAYTYLLKLQRLQNKVLWTTGNFPMYTAVRDLHTAFNLPHTRIYDYITKLCRHQAEVIRNHENVFIRDKPILSLDRMLHKSYDRKGLVAIQKSLVVSLKGLSTETN